MYPVRSTQEPRLSFSVPVAWDKSARCSSDSTRVTCYVVSLINVNNLGDQFDMAPVSSTNAPLTKVHDHSFLWPGCRGWQLTQLGVMLHRSLIRIGIAINFDSGCSQV